MQKLAFVPLFGALASAITINDVPQCAQTCLSNSTSTQTECGVVDLQCLCSNTMYVNTLSCCLATQCSSADQQKAIAFNQAECLTVNETAPGFVGCSPFALSSFVIVGSGSATAFSVSTMTPTASATSVTSTTGTPNPRLTTVTDSTQSGLQAFATSAIVTASFTGNPLLTGTCTVPHFATVVDSMAMMTQYPEVGCSPEREDCCPFPYGENAVLTKCPQDYFSTAGGCCPFGYQVWFTTLGVETPCYTMPAVTYVPAASPTISQLTIITEHVFTRMYELGVPKKKASSFNNGAKIGIAVNVFLLFVMAVLGWVWYRHRERRRQARKEAAALARQPQMEEPVLSPGAHELASPQSQPTSPGSRGNDWPMGNASSPPAYEDTRTRPVSQKPSVPQELPGSTFIYEHHPAHQTPTEQRTNPPSSPPRPSAGASRSPGGHLNPQTPPRSGASIGEASPVISPMASPRI